MVDDQAGAQRGIPLMAAVAVGATCLLMAIGAPGAEDLKGRWSVGGSLFFFSTRDSIRSNATLILGPAGDDGIPFTFDPNENLDCSYPPPDPNTDPNASSTHAYCDPRPDDQLGRPIRIADAPQFNVNVSYGAASWLSFRLDAGYSRSGIAPIDLFVSDHFPRQGNSADPSTMTRFQDRQFTKSIRAGELTEIPVTLSAVFRFRPKRPLNPYIVIGGGKIFTGVQTSNDLSAMNERLGHMFIRGATDEYVRNIVPARAIDSTFDGRIPFLWEMKPRVENSYEWHLGAGIEYFFNSRVSILFEGRSVFADASLDLGLGNQDQINLITWSEKIYRADGSVRIFAPPDPNGHAPAPNPLCSDNGNRGLGCYLADVYTRVNPEGTSINSTVPLYTCPAVGDFDGDGQIDVCYPKGILPSEKGYAESRGDVIVQGGRINLSSVSVGVSLRVHF